MGQNGAGLRNSRPTDPDLCQSQVQFPASSPADWDEVGQTGTLVRISGPDVPAGPGIQPFGPETADGEDDSTSTYPELALGLLEFLGSSESGPGSAGQDSNIAPLTARQLSALPYLASYPSVRQAAKVSGIGKSTLYRWLEDDHFREELIRLREETAEFARHEAKGLMLRAVDVFRESMNSADPNLRLKAARYSLSYTSEVGLAEKLRQDIEHLAVAVDEWKSKRPVP